MHFSCHRQINWRRSYTVRQEQRAAVVDLLVGRLRPETGRVWPGCSGRISVSFPSAIANPTQRSASDRRSTTHRRRAGCNQCHLIIRNSPCVGSRYYRDAFTRDVQAASEKTAAAQTPTAGRHSHELAASLSLPVD